MADLIKFMRDNWKVFPKDIQRQILQQYFNRAERRKMKIK
jgi:hypothetical protein